MKKFILIITMLMLLPMITFAQNVYKITTGYAYITCNGMNTGEINLPIGAQYTPNQGCTLTEVPNQASLDAMTFTPPAQSFDIDKFIAQLAATNLMANPSILPYYAVVKDLSAYQNFQQLANLIAGLFKAGIMKQSDIDTFDTVLENQQINLASYNSDINESY